MQIENKIGRARYREFAFFAREAARHALSV
jgi:hypothetical protein